MIQQWLYSFCRRRFSCTRLQSQNQSWDAQIRELVVTWFGPNFKAVRSFESHPLALRRYKVPEVMDIWWYLGLFRFRWFCILNYSVFSLVFGATAASVWFPACGGGLLHASHEGVNTCFLSDSAALNHATMNSIHNVVPSTLVHGLLTEVSKVAVELESPRPGWLILRWFSKVYFYTLYIV